MNKQEARRKNHAVSPDAVMYPQGRPIQKSGKMLAENAGLE
jgi:hypothetical protein